MISLGLVDLVAVGAGDRVSADQNAQLAGGGERALPECGRLSPRTDEQPCTGLSRVGGTSLPVLEAPQLSGATPNLLWSRASRGSFYCKSFCRSSRWFICSLTRRYADSSRSRRLAVCSDGDFSSSFGEPYITSIGIGACRPNIRLNGVNPVVDCTLVLYAMQRGRRCSSQSNGFSLAAVASIDSSVRLNRSTRPSDCGWYAVVRVLLIPRSLQTSATNSDSNCLP